MKDINERAWASALGMGFGLALVVAAQPATAGSCRDPWVTSAIRQVTGHLPTGSGDYGDCSTYNYGHGHWSSYADLVAKVRAGYPRAQPMVRSAGNCRDPWVTQAIRQVTGHSPTGSGDSGDCSVYRYGNGHWSSYADLVNKVRSGYPGATASAVNGTARPGYQARPMIPNSSLANRRAGIVSTAGGNVIGNNRSGLISQDGGGLRGNGIVAQGAGN